MEKEFNNKHNFSLKDMVNLSDFKNLSNSFTRLTSIPIGIIDLKGEILIDGDWQTICAEFHRKNPITAARCLESDTALANQLAKGEKYNIYKCKNGLVDVAVPILIEKMHVGNLFTGQFFFEPPDIDFFSKQAELYGFNKEAYLEALSQVPIFSTEKIKLALKFLTDLTVIIGNIGIDKVKLFEYSKHLEEQVQDRTKDLQAEIKIRQKTEVELQENKQFLESVFNAIQDGISVLDKDLNVLKVNNKMNQWYPQLKKSIGGKCYKIYHGRSKLCKICPSIRAFRSGEIEMDEVPFASEAEVIGTLELFSFPIKDSAGETTGVVEYMRDITQRKRIEDQIKIEKNFSESLINSLPGVMYVFDQSGNFKRWNENFEIVTGYSENEIEELKPLDFIAAEDKARVGRAIEKVFHEGRVSVEAGLLTISERVIPYFFTGYKLIQNNSNYIVGIGIDISSRVKTEKEKENLLKRLQETLSQVKQLSGFLPICASCKKIRDDKGYWNQIEAYIQSRSEAEFSHSICPECAKKLYPDFIEHF